MASIVALAYIFGLEVLEYQRLQRVTFAFVSLVVRFNLVCFLSFCDFRHR